MIGGQHRSRRLFDRESTAAFLGSSFSSVLKASGYLQPVSSLMNLAAQRLLTVIARICDLLRLPEKILVRRVIEAVNKSTFI